MSESTKRKIAHTWRAAILIIAGIIGILLGLGIIGELVNAGKYGHIIVTILSILSLLIGLYALYDAYIGTPREEDIRADKITKQEQERIEKLNKIRNPNNLINSTNDKNAIPTEQLEMLKKLYDSGVITENEFTEKKKKLLGL